MDYKRAVKDNELMGEPDKQPRGFLSTLCAQTDIKDIFDMSDISQARKHFYFYCLLLLFTLAVHTYQSFQNSGSAANSQVDPETARLIEIGAVAQSFY